LRNPEGFFSSFFILQKFNQGLLKKINQSLIDPDQVFDQSRDRDEKKFNKVWLKLLDVLS